MRAREGISSAIRKVAFAALLGAVCGQASATIVADGKLDGANGSAEGYQLGFTVGLKDTFGNVYATAKVYFGENVGGSEFLYIQMPLGLVDNTYGTNAASDWAAVGGHTFAQLLSGDAQAITFNGTTVTMDYIADCGPPACSASGYQSAGVGPNGTVGGGGGGAGWTYGDGSAPSVAAAAPIKNVATSLEYDLNTVAGNTSANTNSLTSANWIKEVGYEVEFAPGTFNAADWIDKTKAPGLITLGAPDMSPVKTSKTNTFKDYTPPSCIVGCTGTNHPAPEPGTPWLLGSGLMAMVWYARRRKGIQIPDSIKGLLSA